MNPQIPRRAFASAAALLCIAVVWLGAAMTIEFAPVSVPAQATVTAIQFLERPGAPLAVSTGGRLRLLADGVLVDLMPIPEGTAWDARQFRADFSVLYSEAGSAVSSIMSRSQRFPAGGPVSPPGPGVYVRPHFVAEPDSLSGVTALQLSGNTARPVLFTTDPSTGDPVIRELGTAGDPVTDARLLRDGAGFWLVTSRLTDGMSGPPRAGRRPALVVAERLDGTLRADGHAVPVLGSTPVYEFDVTHAGGDQVAIVAATPDGLIVGRGALGSAGMPPDRWSETRMSKPLTSPTLLVEGGVTHVAVIEDAGTPDARILRARVEENR